MCGDSIRSLAECDEVSLINQLAWTTIWITHYHYQCRTIKDRHKSLVYVAIFKSVIPGH